MVWSIHWYATQLWLWIHLSDGSSTLVPNIFELRATQVAVSHGCPFGEALIDCTYLETNRKWPPPTFPLPPSVPQCCMRCIKMCGWFSLTLPQSQEKNLKEICWASHAMVPFRLTWNQPTWQGINWPVLVLPDSIPKIVALSLWHHCIDNAGIPPLI